MRFAYNDPTIPLDAFILTFKDNSEHGAITTQQGPDGKYRTVPAQWLHDITKGEAVYLKNASDGIEIAIPIGTFLEIKDSREFQGRCHNMIRLRTTPKTVLGKLCYPIGHIDNRIK
jgi:hypothetical protein